MKNKYHIYQFFCIFTFLIVGCQKDNKEDMLSEENERLRIKLEKDTRKRETLTARITALEYQLEVAKTQADKESERVKVKGWSQKIGDIIYLLDRVHKETTNFWKAKTKSELIAEERRLVALVRENEAACRQILVALRAENYSRTSDLDKYVKEFTASYEPYASYSRMTVESYRLDPDDKHFKGFQMRYMSRCDVSMKNIRSLAQEVGKNSPED